jgi:hypothetical protein
LNLTWHIARKLLRHLWPWLALIAVVIATRYSLLWQFEHLLDIDRPLFDQTAGTDSRLYIIQHILLGLFIVAVLHEDSPLDRRAFWTTRPISGLRLLAAKLIAIVIGALLLPLAGAILWWLLHDFRACDIVASIPHQLIIPTVVIAIALASALFNRTWIGFFIAFFALVLLAGLGSSSQSRPATPLDSALSATRSSLVFLCAAAGVATGAYQLYRHRRIGLTRWVIAAFTGACLLVHHFWPWPFPARYRFSGNPPPPPAADTAKITVTAQPLRSLAHVATGDTAWYAQLPLTISTLPSDTLPVVRSAKPVNGSSPKSLTVTPTGASKKFSPRFPTSVAATEPHLAILDLKRSDSYQPTQEARSDPFNASIHVSFLLRRTTPAAAVANTPGFSAGSGPYQLRILTPSAPHASKDSSPPELSRTLTCLLVHPSQLTAPGTGIAEFCGAPNDTDEMGRHFDARATLFATLGDTTVTPLSRESGTLTFTADGIFYVRRTLSFDLAPAEIASLKIHYVTYPALGTFERTVAIPATLP